MRKLLVKMYATLQREYTSVVSAAMCSRRQKALAYTCEESVSRSVVWGKRGRGGSSPPLS